MSDKIFKIDDQEDLYPLSLLRGGLTVEMDHLCVVGGKRSTLFWYLNSRQECWNVVTDSRVGDHRRGFDEVASGPPEWQQLVTKYYITGFDDDADGELSLAEYRRVPTENFLAPWHSKRSDRDGDGQLSFSEFHDGHPIGLIALSHEYFGRYDRNNDGKLSLQEFDFRINGEQAPVDISFVFYDENDDNSLPLDELFGDFKGRTDQRAQAVFGRMEEMFLAADADQNKKLSLNEFRAGRKIMDSNGRSKSTNHLIANVACNGEAEEGINRFWIIVTLISASLATSCDILNISGFCQGALTKTPQRSTSLPCCFSRLETLFQLRLRANNPASLGRAD